MELHQHTEALNSKRSFTDEELLLYLNDLQLMITVVCMMTVTCNYRLSSVRQHAHSITSFGPHTKHLLIINKQELEHLVRHVYKDCCEAHVQC